MVRLAELEHTIKEGTIKEGLEMLRKHHTEDAVRKSVEDGRWRLVGFIPTKLKKAKMFEGEQYPVEMLAVLKSKSGKRWKEIVFAPKYEKDFFAWPDAEGITIKSEKVGGKEIYEKFKGMELIGTL